MRALMLQAPEYLLLERRKLGHDRWDEMWEGVLHMVPPPHGKHGRIELQLGTFFNLHWEPLGLGRIYLETGVKPPGVRYVKVAGEDVPVSYRTPDLSFLLPEHFDRFQGGWIVGGPAVALEIVSPGDESREKLPFYFEVGVREAILVQRDSLDVEVRRRGTTELEPIRALESGWIQSEVLRTEFRPEKDASGKPALRVRRSDDVSRELLIGE